MTKLNCRPGDLVVVIKSNKGNNWAIGKVFTVTSVYNGNYWHTHPEFKNSGGQIQVFNDEMLRPIRDQPGEDETLTWAPVPHKETV